ncbi:hypothetical protein DZB84_08045 [Bacillus sp. HNG]|uniref:hypothetical protein n=1 Tax=Bacillus sp. HNG TaxID=2293325 RepID=UPI000E2FA8D2|nr:hypothetical protein [Bacillus sp. HNG]RFB17793.1 hypothetical protein DZB84_08045 [Bacillus sp. HNG]
MYINRRKLLNEKMTHLKNGYSAYAESPDIINALKKEIQALNLNVFEEVTDLGSWFIPVKVDN